MDALALGAAGAAALRIDGLRAWLLARVDALIGAAGGALLTGALISHGYDKYGLIAQSAGYSLLALGFALFVIAAACADARRQGGWSALLRAVALQKLGRYSYAMYVLHGPLQIVVLLPLLRRLGWDRNDSLGLALAFIVVGCVLTYAASALSYRYLEQPFLRMKRYFVARPAPSLQSS
jgi:peptidoglycan/LPS O-acetylase OafA/YrhL